MDRNSRFQDLEDQFSRLEPKIKESPEKQAISVLHAMLLDLRRRGPDGSPHMAENNNEPTLEDISNLYKTAPKMEGKAENQGLPTGSQAPDFSLPDASGNSISLSSLHGKNVVLAFYPLDWSPACSDQLSLYQSELDEFRQYDAEVIGISVDSIYSHGAWAAVRGITFHLLSDFHPKGEVARLYHVWRDSSGFSERALYVIDKNGIIRYKTISPQLDHIPDVYELFDQLAVIEGQPSPEAAD